MRLKRPQRACQKPFRCRPIFPVKQYREAPEPHRRAGTDLKVYLLLRHRRDLTGKPSVIVPGAELAAWHITRQAYSRALGRLEADGLVAVERRSGRPILVTLQD